MARVIWSYKFILLKCFHLLYRASAPWAIIFAKWKLKDTPIKIVCYRFIVSCQCSPLGMSSLACCGCCARFTNTDSQRGRLFMKTQKAAMTFWQILVCQCILIKTCAYWCTYCLFLQWENLLRYECLNVKSINVFMNMLHTISSLIHFVTFDYSVLLHILLGQTACIWAKAEKGPKSITLFALDALAALQRCRGILTGKVLSQAPPKKDNSACVAQHTKPLLGGNHFFLSI